MKQQEEIKAIISKCERKLDEIRSLRESLDLEPGNSYSGTGFSSVVGLISAISNSSSPVSVFPSQGAATWWYSDTREPPLTYDELDWHGRSRTETPRTLWNAGPTVMWTQLHGPTATETGSTRCIKDVIAMSDLEAQTQMSTRTLSRSGTPRGSRKKREADQWVEEAVKEPKQDTNAFPAWTADKPAQGLTGRLSEMFTPAQEAIRATWAAAT